jgi:hypothetical protein
VIARAVRGGVTFLSEGQARGAADTQPPERALPSKPPSD